MINPCSICKNEAQIRWLEKAQDFCLSCWISITKQLNNRFPTIGLLEYIILETKRSFAYNERK